jgi:endonuclease/exonuclease/phosphatase family metal-dependent hydrolase
MKLWTAIFFTFSSLILCSSSFALKDNSLTIASFNIRNYGSSNIQGNAFKGKPQLLRSILKKTGADIIAVQEIVDAVAFKNFIKKQVPEYSTVLSRCGGRGRQKLGFIYKKNVFKLIRSYEDHRIKETKESCHTGVRPLMVGEFKNISTDKLFTAFSVHLKAGGSAQNIRRRGRQMQILQNVLSEYEKNNHPYYTIMGDFNTTEYLSGNQYYKRFINFVTRADMADLTSELECTSYWHGGRRDGINYPSFLDHILVGEGLNQDFPHKEIQVQAHCQRHACQQERERDMAPSFGEVSDHCPIVAKLK